LPGGVLLGAHAYAGEIALGLDVIEPFRFIGEVHLFYLLKALFFRVFEVTILLFCSFTRIQFWHKFEKVLISWRLQENVAVVQQTPFIRLVFMID